MGSDLVLFCLVLIESTRQREAAEGGGAGEAADGVAAAAAARLRPLQPPVAIPQRPDDVDGGRRRQLDDVAGRRRLPRPLRLALTT